MENLLLKNLGCIDAYVLMGSWMFYQTNRNPENLKIAKIYYGMGIRIVLPTISLKFNDVLSLKNANNKSFLRCFVGYGVCLWREKNYKWARKIFKKVLLLNPSTAFSADSFLVDLDKGLDWDIPYIPSEKIKPFEISFHSKLGFHIKLKRISKLMPKRFKYKPLFQPGDLIFFQINTQIAQNLLVAKIFAALDFFAGSSDEDYDPHKGSFSFNFELELDNSGIKSRYLLNLIQYRTGIRNFLYEILPHDDEEDERSYKTQDPEIFSDEQMKDFFMWFYAYLDAAATRLENSEIKPKPFIKSVYSDFFITGFKNDHYFYEQFNLEEEYLSKMEFYKA